MSDNDAAIGGSRERLRAVSSSLGLALLGSIAGIATLVVLARLLISLGLPVRENIALRYGLSAVSLQGIGFMVVVLVYFRARDRFDLIDIRVPTLRDVGLMVVGVVSLLGLLFLLQFVYNQLGIETPQVELVEHGLENPALMLYLIPLAYLFIGPGEELMFRGAVQGILRESYTPSLAVVIASVVFAIAHFMNVVGAPPGQKAAYLIAIFTLSLLLGALYEYSENLLVPIVVHGTYDTIIFVAIYARAVGLG